MRKIGFFNYVSFLAASAILGIVASAGLIFLTKPYPVQVQNIPLVGFNNAQLFNNSIVNKADLFGGPLADAMNPKKVAAPEIPKIPSSPAGHTVSESERISVIGIMPPSACIIRRGSEMLSVVSGEKTAFGTIGDVTAEGVYIDGKLYKMPSGL